MATRQEQVEMVPQSESSGNESAEQQLFAESQASASKLQQPPNTSAVRSANLLNAARRRTIAHAATSPSDPHGSWAPDFASSPIDMIRRKDGAGRLKRPSFMREDMARQPRLDLTRRRDVYDMIESPEKMNEASPFKLPQTVNRKPLKRVKKDDKAAAGDEPVDLDQQAADPALATAPPPRASGRLAGEVADISSVDFAKEPGSRSQKHTRAKRKANGQELETEKPPKSPRRGAESASGQATAQTTTGNRRTLRSQAKGSNPQVVIPTRRPTALGRSTARMNRSVDRDDEGPAQLQDGHSDAEADAPENITQQPTKRGRGRQPKKAKDTNSQASTDARPDANTVSATLGRKQTRASARRRDEEVEDGTTQEAEPEVEVESPLFEPGPEADEASDLGAHRNTYTGADSIGRVFQFLDSEERQGSCQTKGAASIRRACQVAQERTQRPDLTLKELSDTSLDIRAMLADRGANKEQKQLKAIKTDAYAHLFRDLIGYLETVYGWLEERYGDVTQSLEAMEILTPFVSDILSFKDTIASWKVSLPSRYKDDKLIMDVDSKIIKPLRNVETTYRAILSQLAAAARARKTHEELSQKRKERLAEHMRQEDDAAQRRKRWECWQDLHVWRQFREPDHFRRRRLFIDPQFFASKFENVDERDANGFKFERVPVFKQRDSPPARRSLAGAEDDWTDEQMAALIDGLKEFAGPKVFRKIFKAYCRPGGALRSFTVSEITAQATSIRAGLLDEYQSKGWEVPDWIIQIPVLP